jgi:hypothetical protein
MERLKRKSGSTREEEESQLLVKRRRDLIGIPQAMGQVPDHPQVNKIA